jgi:hypothetical protein
MKWFAASTAIIVVCVAYLYLAREKPSAPPILHLSACKGVERGARRIGDQYGIQFDIPEKSFAIAEGTSDAIPVMRGFHIKPQNSSSALEIYFGQRPLQTMVSNSALTFSRHVDKRSVFDATGHVVGQDYWGYLGTGERSREVQFFHGGAIAKYQFISRREADLFDSVISSACFLSPPN